MADQLAVDPDELTQLAQEYAALANTVAASLQKLNTGLGNCGEPWGDDEPGRTFAQSYLPALHQVLDGLNNAVQGVRSQGAGLAQFAQAITAQDGATAAGVGAHPTGTSPAISPTEQTPSATGATPASSAAVPQSAGSTANPAGTPAESSGSPAASSAGASSPTQSQTPQSQSPGQQSQSPSQQSPSQQSPGQQSPGGQQSQSPEDQSPSQQPRRQSQAPQSPQRQTAAAAGRGSATAQNSPASAATAPSPPATEPAVPVRPTVSPPATSRAPGPAPKQPRSGTPADDEEEPARRGAGKDAAEKGKDAAARRGASNRPTSDPRGRELARALAQRHGIEVTGFDAPEIDYGVLAEFAAALDDVLPAYPMIDLRGAGIWELPPDQVSTALWNWEPGSGGPQPYTAWIVLATAVARDPQDLASRVNAAVESGELVPGSEQRPVYSTIVRELGRALDVAGGFRARSRAQHALLVDYLPTVGDQAGMRAVLDSYRDWRGELRGHSFYGPRLHPGTALAEAFTDVHLHGMDASAPARALHQLLVEAAAVRAPKPLPNSGDPIPEERG